MWRLAKVLKDTRQVALNRSTSCLWKATRNESSTSKDSDVKEVPYNTLQVMPCNRYNSIFIVILMNSIITKHFFLTVLQKCNEPELNNY